MCKYWFLLPISEFFFYYSGFLFFFLKLFICRLKIFRSYDRAFSQRTQMHCPHRCWTRARSRSRTSGWPAWRRTRPSGSWSARRCCRTPAATLCPSSTGSFVRSCVRKAKQSKAMIKSVYLFSKYYELFILTTTIKQTNIRFEFLLSSCRSVGWDCFFSFFCFLLQISSSDSGDIISSEPYLTLTKWCNCWLRPGAGGCPRGKQIFITKLFV